MINIKFNIINNKQLVLTYIIKNDLGKQRLHPFQARQTLRPPDHHLLLRQAELRPQARIRTQGQDQLKPLIHHLPVPTRGQVLISTLPLHGQGEHDPHAGVRVAEAEGAPIVGPEQAVVS